MPNAARDPPEPRSELKLAPSLEVGVFEREFSFCIFALNKNRLALESCPPDVQTSLEMEEHRDSERQPAPPVQEEDGADGTDRETAAEGTSSAGRAVDDGGQQPELPDTSVADQMSPEGKMWLQGITALRAYATEGTQPPGPIPPPAHGGGQVAPATGPSAHIEEPMDLSVPAPSLKAVQQPTSETTVSETTGSETTVSETTTTGTTQTTADTVTTLSTVSSAETASDGAFIKMEPLVDTVAQAAQVTEGSSQSESDLQPADDQMDWESVIDSQFQTTSAETITTDSTATVTTEPSLASRETLTTTDSAATMITESTLTSIDTLTTTTDSSATGATVSDSLTVTSSDTVTAATSSASEAVNLDSQERADPCLDVRVVQPKSPPRRFVLSPVPSTMPDAILEDDDDMTTVHVELLSDEREAAAEEIAAEEEMDAGDDSVLPIHLQADFTPDQERELLGLGEEEDTSETLAQPVDSLDENHNKQELHMAPVDPASQKQLTAEPVVQIEKLKLKIYKTPEGEEARVVSRERPLRKATLATPDPLAGDSQAAAGGAADSEEDSDWEPEEGENGSLYDEPESEWELDEVVGGEEDDDEEEERPVKPGKRKKKKVKKEEVIPPPPADHPEYVYIGGEVGKWMPHTEDPRVLPEKGYDSKGNQHRYQCTARGCKHFGKSYASLDTYRRHWLDFHQRYGFYIPCPMAGCNWFESCSRAEQLRRHMERHHHVSKPAQERVTKWAKGEANIKGRPHEGFLYKNYNYVPGQNTYAPPPPKVTGSTNFWRHNMMLKLVQPLQDQDIINHASTVNQYCRPDKRIGQAIPDVVIPVGARTTCECLTGRIHRPLKPRKHATVSVGDQPGTSQTTRHVEKKQKVHRSPTPKGSPAKKGKPDKPAKKDKGDKKPSKLKSVVTKMSQALKKTGRVQPTTTTPVKTHKDSGTGPYRIPIRKHQPSRTSPRLAALQKRQQEWDSRRHEGRRQSSGGGCDTDWHRSPLAEEDWDTRRGRSGRDHWPDRRGDDRDQRRGRRDESTDRRGRRGDHAGRSPDRRERRSSSRDRRARSRTPERDSDARKSQKEKQASKDQESSRKERQTSTDTDSSKKEKQAPKDKESDKESDKKKKKKKKKEHYGPPSPGKVAAAVAKKKAEPKSSQRPQRWDVVPDSQMGGGSSGGTPAPLPEGIVGTIPPGDLYISTPKLPVKSQSIYGQMPKYKQPGGPDLRAWEHTKHGKHLHRNVEIYPHPSQDHAPDERIPRSQQAIECERGLLTGKDSGNIHGDENAIMQSFQDPDQAADDEDRNGLPDDQMVEQSEEEMARQAQTDKDYRRPSTDEETAQQMEVEAAQNVPPVGNDGQQQVPKAAEQPAPSLMGGYHPPPPTGHLVIPRPCTLTIPKDFDKVRPTPAHAAHLAELIRQQPVSLQGLIDGLQRAAAYAQTMAELSTMDAKDVAAAFTNAHERREALEGEVNHHQQVIQDLQRQLADQQAVAAAHDNTHTELVAREAALMERETKLAEQISEVAAKDRTIEQQAAKIAALEKDTEELRKGNGNLLRKCTQRKLRIENLETSEEGLKNSYDRSLAVEENLRGEIKKLEEAKAAADARINSLELDLAAANSQLNRKPGKPTVAQNLQHQQKIIDAERRRTVAESEVAWHKEKADRLEQQLIAQTQQLAGISFELATYKTLATGSYSDDEPMGSDLIDQDAVDKAKEQMDKENRGPGPDDGAGGGGAPIST